MHLALISKDYNHSSNDGVVNGSNFKRDDLGLMTFSPRNRHLFRIRTFFLGPAIPWLDICTAVFTWHTFN